MLMKEASSMRLIHGFKIRPRPAAAAISNPAHLNAQIDSALHSFRDTSRRSMRLFESET